MADMVSVCGIHEKITLMVYLWKCLLRILVIVSLYWSNVSQFWNNFHYIFTIEVSWFYLKFSAFLESFIKTSSLILSSFVGCLMIVTLKNVLVLFNILFEVILLHSVQWTLISQLEKRSFIVYYLKANLLNLIWILLIEELNGQRCLIVRKDNLWLDFAFNHIILTNAFISLRLFLK